MKDARKIQEVLQLHVDSAESMRDTYKRVGDQDGVIFERGMIAGLQRAIEVANYMDARNSAPTGGPDEG